MVALYEGATGNPADADDADAYHEVIGKPKFPVVADGSGKIWANTPLDAGTNPQMCALSDELEIISCHEGHGGHELALDDIRDFAGL